MSKPVLTIKRLQTSAREFAKIESSHDEPSLYGVTDGKAVGTYLEHKFRSYLQERYDFEEGNSAKGIDFPDLNVDMKATSVRQPQSSCPFKSARQKIFGLGYSLLVLVYEKTDDDDKRTGRLDILHVIFVMKEQTGDYQLTRSIRQILESDGNKDDLIALMADRNLPVEDIEAGKITDDLLSSPPNQGYLTISNALQWRLQYGRVIEKAGSVDGVLKVK